MHVKLIPRCGAGTTDPLREALCLPGAGRLFQQALLEQSNGGVPSTALVVPAEWLEQLDKGQVHLQPAAIEGLPIASSNGTGRHGLLIFNARLEIRYDPDHLKTLLDASGPSVVAVDIAPELAATNELVRKTSDNRIVGFRRLFEDVAEPVQSPGNRFPAILYFPPAALERLGRNARIPLDAASLAQWLIENKLPFRRFRMGGQVTDLSSPDGLLSLLKDLPVEQLSHRSATASIDPAARLIGPIWAGEQICIERDAIVTGPAILCKGVRLEPGSGVHTAIVGPDLTISPNQRIRNALFLSENSQQELRPSCMPNHIRAKDAFRNWPFFSYARMGKRLCDILFSLMILMLISPIFVIVAVMIKLTSRGPIFYGARRQGLHGKEFKCLKFRTMMVQADTMQERLRIANEVDGPQFKMENDPRITGVGKFLRDTCIDELPQFINVLLGQMSVVGPRPSPENENECCPLWRDARLSVRPGITGMWQVCRTRQEGQDFQEWVFYDTKYVRNLSFHQDLYICYKTASKLINNFLDQFG